MNTVITKPCRRCGNIGLLRVHRVGWYFVKCHNCSNFGDSVIGKTDPDEEQAVKNWNDGILDERFWQVAPPSPAKHTNVTEE